MPNRSGIRSFCVLFTCAVLGLAFASILYVTSPEILPLNDKNEAIWLITGILLPLTLAFLSGFSDIRLFSLSCLAAVRFFSLTLSCYSQYSRFDLHFFLLLLLAGIEGLLFLSFCRLSYLFGYALRRDPVNKRKYILQFIGDYLFFCGICVAIAWICTAQTVI